MVWAICGKKDRTRVVSKKFNEGKGESPQPGETMEENRVNPEEVTKND